MSTARSESRTHRRHLQTVEEVKSIARERLQEDGAGGISLRAIAREMGVVPSALYRYFPSHGHLMDAVAQDAAMSMLDRLQHACDPLPVDDFEGRLVASLRAYRTWALENSSDHALNFGALASAEPEHESPTRAVERAVNFLFDIVRDAHAAGKLDLAQCNVGSAATEHLESLSEEEKTLTELRVATLSVWCLLNGTVTLEVSGRLPEIGISADQFFEAQLRSIVDTLGFSADDG